MFHKQLTWACDLIILNACCLTALQAWLVGTDWLWVMSLLNCTAVVVLRQWLMRSLKITWMTSPLNRALKRTADIMVAILFLATALPVLIAVHTIIIKSSKRHRGPLFTAKEVNVGGKRRFTAIVFSNCQWNGSLNMGMTPLAMRLLTGAISLGDLPSLSISDLGNDAAEPTSEPAIKEHAECQKEHTEHTEEQPCPVTDILQENIT